MANRKAVLVWYCKTEKGWRRFPVVMAKNNRIKTGYVLVDDKEQHYPEGRFQVRKYLGRKTIYVNVAASAPNEPPTGADALSALDKELGLLEVKHKASIVGAKLLEEPGRLYLRRAARDFEDDARNRNALEAASVNKLVCEEFLSVTGLTFADELTRDHVYRFHRALRARGCSDRTVANKHARLKSFLKFAGLPYKEILPPAPKYEKKLPTKYTSEQNGDILKAADGYMAVAINLALKAGLREQELAHVEWSDIHREDALLRVTGKPHWNFKIKDSEQRDVPLSAELLDTLKEWEEVQAKMFRQQPRLILATKNGKPPTKLLRRLKRLAKAQGLNCGVCEGCTGKNEECENWTLQKFRRTFCTTLLRSGIDIRTVQAIMGHADLETTMRYLTPASAGETQAQVNAIQW